MKTTDKINKTENIQLKHLLIELRKASNAGDVKIWKRVAEDLAKPTRSRRSVNVAKLSRYVKENETIVVPGKVLGTGSIDKSIIVAAYSFSESAKAKIGEAKGSCMKISELIRKNPKGSKVRIIG